GNAARHEAEADIGLDAHPGEEAALLEHHRVLDRPARRLDLDRAAGLGGKPREDAQQRRFPAARWSDDADELARCDAQVDVVEGHHGPGPARVLLAKSDVAGARAAPLAGLCFLPPADALTSAAPGELALLVLEHERGELAQRVIDVALVHDPIGREL